MRLNIKPIKNEHLDCFESIIATVTLYFKLNYELCFIYSWNFYYEAVNGKSEKLLLGNRINRGWRNEDRKLTFDVLKKYHGLHMSKHHVDRNLDYVAFLKILKSELNNSKPLLVKFDAFHCHWSVEYLFKHRGKFCLIVGVDAEKNTVFCLKNNLQELAS